MLNRVKAIKENWNGIYPTHRFKKLKQGSKGKIKKREGIKNENDKNSNF